MNVIIPMAGKSNHFGGNENYLFPKPLIEVAGEPMLQKVITPLLDIEGDLNYIFIIQEDDAVRYHLDYSIRLLLQNKKVTVITQSNYTKGAILSILLAIDNINENEQVLVLNADQVIDIDYMSVIDNFDKKGAAAGLVCFDSIHPQWSYAQIDKNGEVEEVAEKKPISRNAIAGFYYYQKASDFIDAAKSVIEKDTPINGYFYTSQTINELILKNQTVLIHKIRSDQYHSFYSPNKIIDYEKSLLKN